MREYGRWAFFVGALCLTTAPSSSSDEAQGTAVWAPAAATILEALDDHPLVCLGEDHGSRRDHELRLALVAHPRFHEQVDVVVVEFANPLHQATLDRYIAGEEVDGAALARVWRDTTQLRVWDSPIYEEFLRAVRDENTGRLPDGQVRVVAADPPIDWPAIRTSDELADFLDRNHRGSYPIEVIERELFSQGKRGLAIFGAQHCERGGLGFTAEIEARHPASTFVVLGVDPDDENRLLHALGPEPRLLRLGQPPLEALDRSLLFPYARAAVELSAERLADAILWTGSFEERVIRFEGTRSPDYAQELRRRMNLLVGAVKR
jgi:Haem-binding uptake, Tiki superfamily, ChaN